jgi:DNA polymerase III delta subunit
VKLKESDFANILKNKLQGIPAMLMYGPDSGKTGEFVDKIIEKLEIPADNVVSSDGSGFRENFDAIYSDACSAAMFGGNKLVLVVDPDGRDLPLIKKLCESESLCAPVVIPDGELESKSALRLFFEDSEKCAVMPLYADDEQSLGTLIRGELAKCGITKIDADAMSYMFRHLGKDRAIARGFLNKIALYACDKKSVSLEDAEKCLPDAGAANMDEFKYNLTAGNITQTLRMLDRLFFENVNPAVLVRALGNHFKDLLNCVAGGQMPRVFWKYNTLFDAARRIWTEKDLSEILIKINKLESDTRGSLDAELAFRDFSLKLATKAYKLAVSKRRK